MDALPDDAGRVVLFYDALDLPGDETLYSADPNNQPPPPNLQGVRTVGDPNQRGPLAFILTTSKPVWAVGEPVAFEMLLQNLSDEPQQVDLPSGQDFDITVTDEAGREVWRWSSGRFFTQVFRSLTLQPREQRTYRAEWDQRDAEGRAAPPGRYQATAVFASTDRLASNPVSFTIAAGGQGQRPQNYAVLVDALRASGATAEDTGPVNSPILGGEVRSLRVNGETLQVFEYANEADAATDAARLSPDGTTYRGPNRVIAVDYIAPPHVYRSGRIIVIYAGRDASLPRLLETLLGPQVAGG